MARAYRALMPREESNRTLCAFFCLAFGEPSSAPDLVQVSAESLHVLYTEAIFARGVENVL